jgi:hypothetical protein
MLFLFEKYSIALCNCEQFLATSKESDENPLETDPILIICSEELC